MNMNIEGLNGDNRFLHFSLGEEYFAIPLLTVREVIGVPDVTPIPYMPAYFLGMMNLRGQVISVIDLRMRLGIKPKKEGAEQAVVILDLQGISVGVVVDAVNHVLSVEEGMMSGPPDVEGGKSSTYVRGVIKQNEKLSLWIDMSDLLKVEDLKKARMAKAA